MLCVCVCVHRTTTCILLRNNVILCRRGFHITMAQLWSLNTFKCLKRGRCSLVPRPPPRRDIIIAKHIPTELCIFRHVSCLPNVLKQHLKNPHFQANITPMLRFTHGPVSFNNRSFGDRVCNVFLTTSPTPTLITATLLFHMMRIA
jgi:hypothetical protein